MSKKLQLELQRATLISVNSCCLVFAFVPLEDVNETFEYIVENAEENFNDLMDYVEDLEKHMSMPGMA